MRRLVGFIALALFLGLAPSHAQQPQLPTITPPPGVKVTPLVTDAQVSGVADKVFVPHRRIRAERRHHRPPHASRRRVRNGGRRDHRHAAGGRRMEDGQCRAVLLRPRLGCARDQEYRRQAGAHLQRVHHREGKAARHSGAVIRRQATLRIIAARAARRCVRPLRLPPGMLALLQSPTGSCRPSR